MDLMFRLSQCSLLKDDRMNHNVEVGVVSGKKSLKEFGVSVQE